MKPETLATFPSLLLDSWEAVVSSQSVCLTRNPTDVTDYLFLLFCNERSYLTSSQCNKMFFGFFFSDPKCNMCRVSYKLWLRLFTSYKTINHFQTVLFFTLYEAKGGVWIWKDSMQPFLQRPQPEHELTMMPAGLFSRGNNKTLLHLSQRMSKNP